MLGAVLMTAAFGLQPANAADQKFPDPSDTAKLYENAKAEGGKISYYSGQPADQAAAIIKAFEAKYPGITVEPIRLVGPRLYERYMKEKQAGQNIADILYVSDYATAIDLVDQGITAEWKVPSFDRIPDENKRKINAYAPQYTDVTIAYNTNKVTPEEVEILKKWNGVLDPRFKGRFAVSTLACGICYAGVQMFLTQPGYGKEFLQKVADQKPTVFPSTVVALDRVVAGELDFVFWSFETAIIPIYSRGAPVRWIHPSPTPLLGNTWIEIPTNAPHPNAARLFTTWLTSEDGADAIMSTGGQSTMIGVKDTRPVTKEPWFDPIKEVYHVDYKRWEKSYFTDMKIWTDILKSVH